MTTVTLNGHTGVPAIVPMAQIKQYLPDGRFAGLRMKGSNSKGGKTLPFIPHFVDSRATLLDLRPEANKGCTEFFYVAKETPSVAAVAATEDENKQSRSGDDEKETAFSPPSQPRVDDQRQPKSSKTPPLAQIRADLSTSHESIAEIIPPSNEDSTLEYEQVNVDANKKTSPSQPKQQQEENKLNLNPQDLISHLFSGNRPGRRFGSNEDPNNRRKPSPGPKSREDQLQQVERPLPPAATKRRESPTTNINSNNNNAFDEEEPRSTSKTIEELMRQGRDAYNTAVAAVVSASKNLHSDDSDGENNNNNNNNNNEISKDLAHEPTAAFNDDNNKNNKNKKINAKSPDPDPQNSNSSNKKTKDDQNQFGALTTNARSMSEEVIHAAKTQFQRSQKFLKDRLGRIVDDHEKSTNDDNSKTDQGALVVVVNPATPEAANNKTRIPSSNNNNSTSFPGGKFSRKPAKNNNDDNDDDQIVSDEDQDAMARRARTMTGLRGLVRNEEAMAVGFPVGTTVEPRYTRRNEWYTAAIARRSAQPLTEESASLPYNNHNNNNKPVDPPSASIRTAKGPAYYDTDDEIEDKKLKLSKKPQLQKQQQQPQLPANLRSINPYGQHRHPDEDSTQHLVQPHWKRENETEATVASLIANKPDPTSDALHHQRRNSHQQQQNPETSNNKNGKPSLAPPHWKHEEAEADFQSMSNNNNNNNNTSPTKNTKSPGKNSNDESNPLSQHRATSLTAEDLKKISNEGGDSNPLARSVPKKQARINSARNETGQAFEGEEVNKIKNKEKKNNNDTVASPVPHVPSDDQQPSDSSSSSSTSLNTEEREARRKEDDPNYQGERKSYNVKWVRDRADALRLLLGGLAILIGICIACMDRDSWMVCEIRTVTRAIRGVIITGTQPLIADSENLVNIVGTHVYVSAKTGIWESCVTARINMTEEGKLLRRWEDNLRYALKTVRDGVDASTSAEVLKSVAEWTLTDGSTILTAAGFPDALPVYEICRLDLRDHAECQTFLGLTFVRIATLAVLTLVFSGIFFVSIVLDLAIVKCIKVKIHRVVLTCFLIFIWSVSLSVWILYVDSANVPAIAGATHAECELEANLREPLAAIAFATMQVANNATRYNNMLGVLAAENRTFFNATENATLSAMIANLSTVPSSALAHRVMYFDDCKIGFSTIGWLAAWLIFTVVIALYILARFSAYSSFNRAQADAHPFNPANLFRFGLQYMLPSVFAAGNSETNPSEQFGDSVKDSYLKNSSPEHDDEEDDDGEYYTSDDDDDEDIDDENEAEVQQNQQTVARDSSFGNNNNINVSKQHHDDDGEIVELTQQRTASSGGAGNEPYGPRDDSFAGMFMTNTNSGNFSRDNKRDGSTSKPGSPLVSPHSPASPQSRITRRNNNLNNTSSSLKTTTSGGNLRAASNVNASNPGHRKGRGSRGSGEHDDFLSRTLGAVSGVVGAIVESFASPNANNNISSNNNDNDANRRGHRNRGGSNGSGGNTTTQSSNPRSPPQLLNHENIRRSGSMRQQQQQQPSAATANPPTSNNVGPPPEHHRRRSSGQSSTGSRKGERSFFQTLTAMAVDKVVPFVIGMPPDVQKREASRLIRQMYPNTPAPLVNKIVEFVVDSARVLAKEAQDEVHKAKSQADYDDGDNDDYDDANQGASINSNNLG